MTLQTSDPRVKWEFAMYSIRKRTIKYSKEELSAETNLEKGLSFMGII